MKLSVLLPYLCLSSFHAKVFAQLSDGSLTQPKTIATVLTDGSFKQPDTLRGRRLANGRDIEIDLSFEAGSHVTVAADVLETRLLGGSLPGPTIRVRRGECLIVNFFNKLKEQSGTNAVLNEFSFPDMGNLHFHGSHVSGERPAGDSTIIVGPGESYRYNVCYPDSHIGGIHWVHPHVHGAGTLHVGGGAALALIVEDEPGEVPPEVENAEEVILMVQNFDKDTFDEDVIPVIKDKIFDLQVAAGVENDFLLVNGLYNTTMDITAGQWQRWRIVFGAWNKKPLDLEIDSDGDCEMNLLAKDGIYINDYPRSLDTVPIPVGGRADIMVRCKAAGLYTVNSYLGDLFRLNVVEPENGPVLWTYPTTGFTFSRPPYLKDLTGRTASPGCACNTWLDDDKMNQLSYEPGVFLHKIARGSIVERTVEGVDSHPYHQHVYPFQIIELSSEIDENDSKYFKVGDYQDSLTVRSSEMVKIQYEASTFNGRIAVHCHRITHSDVGMLATEIVLDNGVCECSPRNATLVGGLTLGPTDLPPQRPPPTSPPIVGLPKIGDKITKKKDKRTKVDKKVDKKRIR
jgi:FtsP/CotA-like multicopper oxidase with cupredoxin domain